MAQNSPQEDEITPEVVPTPEPLASAFAALGIEAVTYAHPAVFTVEQGRGFKDKMPGGHTKNLFLKDKKGQVWLVTALWDTDIDLKWLPKRIDAGRLSFGNAELMQRLLGVTPGAVTALGLVNDTDRQVRFVLDSRMLQCSIVNCHPLTNDMTTGLSPQDLLKFIKNMGYEPIIVDFAGG
ncbi:MAG: prolyl-tRNA synthetase associated domain-containing protein [Alphaproteobacteria bacterium]|nr:prolyl-tRNA synthetase associated domain-containing protein [Alphaproteobacteria bacterium]